MKAGWAMILCYAWTDTQIDNLIRIRKGIYPNQKVDLLIYKLSRVSNELIAAVQAEQIFDHVDILEMPEFYLERRRKGFSEKLEAVFLGRKYREYFGQQLSRLIGGREYSHFLTSAFWSESLLVIQYLKKCRRDIAITLYEEGLSAYNGPPNWLFQAVPARSMKAKIRTVLYYGMTSFTYRKYVDGIYLYKPELSNVDYLEKRQIPLENNRIEIVDQDLKHFCDGEIEYVQSDIIYIAEAPKRKDSQPLQDVERVLDMIFSVKEDAKVVVKAHPIMQYQNTVLDRRNHPKVHVDCRAEPIERILMNIQIDDKVVITGNSSSALYIKWVYGKSPYIILIINKRKKALKEYAQHFIENYDAGKAYALNSEENLQELLKLILLKRETLDECDYNRKQNRDRAGNRGEIR